MITTVTFNPAVDKTIELRDFQIGKLNRVDHVKMDPGGKGINVARMIRNLGDRPVALSILGGTAGRYIDQVLTREGVTCDFIWSKQETRTNIKVKDTSTGVVTEINSQGVSDPVDLPPLLAKIERWADQSDILILSGSLPEGVPKDIYYQVIHQLKDKKVKIILDADDEILLHGLKAVPYLIKPNRCETERIVGYQLKTDNDICQAVDYFLEQGVEMVVISLDQDGSVLGSRQGIWRVKPPLVQVCGTVGAGDTLVAGMAYQLERHADPLEMIHFATALAANYVSQPRGSIMELTDLQDLLEQVEISSIERTNAN